MVNERDIHVSAIDPEDLSMQYLHSNSILSLLSELGVHLDIFFKFLWRHILILELIKIRYKDSKESKHNLLQILYSDGKKAEQKALRYLSEHGDQYWITADTHIKNFTSELETKVTEDNEIGAKIKGVMSELNAKTGDISERIIKEGLAGEIVERTQSIVNDYQIAALNEVVKRLSEKSFQDDKKKFHIIIDDLDKNWMPNDKFYIELIKSLLYTVRELTQKMNSAKILIALRTNIYYRIFKKSSAAEPQREKWVDVLVDIEWKRDELKELIDKRLSSIFRGQYTKDTPSIEELLPPPKKKIGKKAFDYILERTFYRPRDVIEFINICIEENDGNLNLSWSNITSAEMIYSKNRLNSVIDEWKDSFYGLPSTFVLLEKYPARFNWDDFNEEDVYKIFEYNELTKCSWLTNLFNGFCNDTRDLASIKSEILNVLYLTGIIGFKDAKTNSTTFSYQKPVNLSDITLDNIKKSTFIVHRMFWKALGIVKEN
jgi:hypothetical protein